MPNVALSLFFWRPFRLLPTPDTYTRTYIHLSVDVISTIYKIIIVSRSIHIRTINISFYTLDILRISE